MTARFRAERRDVSVPSAIIPAQAGIQYSRDAADWMETPRRTGSPAFAGDDDLAQWSCVLM
jgi:hypothetical protein